MGTTEEEVLATGRRFTVALRTVVLLCLGFVPLLSIGATWTTVSVAVVLTAWNAVFVLVGPRHWVLAVDLALLVALSLTQRWTIDGHSLHDNTNWVLAATSITALAHQWYTTVAVGAGITTVIVLAQLAGGAVAGTWPGNVPIVVWTFGEAALSRALLLLVRSGGRTVDRAVAHGEQARRQAAVAAARRADEREHLALLHDTAASTLFAAGTGAINGDEPWLTERALGDLAAFTGEDDASDHDLSRMLGDVARTAATPVDLRLSPVTLPAGPAAAICRSVREALANVARHAGTGTATLTVTRFDGLVRVDVVDHGVGFDTGRVSPHARGISLSIVERMRRVGGLATVTSAAGEGTRVRLEWPRD